jgi:polysaccharide biosynthesis protein PslH
LAPIDNSVAANRSDSHALRGHTALLGKTVAIIHPAWHSCGTHQVLVGQANAYKRLGAKVISLALMDAVTPFTSKGARWNDYRLKSRDLVADQKHETSARISDFFTTALLKDGWWRLIHGDQAAWLVELAKRAPLPAGLDMNAIDLIHANHFFVLPFVEKMLEKRRVPVVLDTHDVQARQYVLRNRGQFFISPYVCYEEMLQVELDWTRRADACVHINAEEYATFRRLLPTSRHELIYPSIAPASSLDAIGAQAMLVASNNAANYHSVRWFLEEVMPLAPEMPVSIFGDINESMRRRDRPLYQKHRNLFKGRIANIQAAYEAAAVVLLPTTEGHGLSIKTLEALSSGLPLVATSRAFRGMGVDPAELRNVFIADHPAAFAIAMLRALKERGDPKMSDTRALCERKFSSDGYAARLEELASKLMRGGQRGARFNQRRFVAS